MAGAKMVMAGERPKSKGRGGDMPSSVGVASVMADDAKGHNRPTGSQQGSG